MKVICTSTTLLYIVFICYGTYSTNILLVVNVKVFPTMLFNYPILN